MKLFNQIKTLNRIAVIEFDPEERNQAKLLVLKRTKSDLLVEQAEEVSLDEWRSELPVVWKVKGKALTKLKSDPNEGFSRLFPNLNEREFHWVDLGDRLSVVRLTSIEHGLSLLSHLNVVGVFHGDDLEKQLELLSEIKETAVELVWGNNIVKTAYKNALAAGLSFFIGLPTSSIEHLERNLNDQQDKQVFQRVGVVFLATLLVALLGNFFVFSQLNTQKQELSNELLLNQSVLSQLASLESQYKEKSTFLENASWMHSSDFSKKADELAALLPSKIQLTKLEMSPLIVDKTDLQKVQFDPGSIIIEGKCDQSSLLNLWKKEVSQLKWVKKIKIEEYNRTDKGATFQIIISC